jgi:hypothetical protein
MKTLRITPIVEVAEYRDAAAVLAVLNRGIAEIDARIEALQVAAYFAANPEEAKRAAPRLLANRGEPPDASTQTAAAGSGVVGRALALLSGAASVPLNPQREIEELRRRRDVVHQAIFAQREIVEAVRSRLSFEAAQAAKEQHTAALLGVLRAARQLAAAAQAERDVRAALMAAGFDSREDLLPPPALGPALLLGSETAIDSPLWSFRRRLEEAGILP